MVGDPSAITATARSQEKPMLLILQTGSAAGPAGPPARARPPGRPTVRVLSGATSDTCDVIERDDARLSYGIPITYVSTSRHATCARHGR